MNIAHTVFPKQFNGNLLSSFLLIMILKNCFFLFLFRSVRPVIKIIYIDWIVEKKSVRVKKTPNKALFNIFLPINLKLCVRLTYWFGAVHTEQAKKMKEKKRETTHAHYCKRTCMHRQMSIYGGWTAIIMLFPHLGSAIWTFQACNKWSKIQTV